MQGILRPALLTLMLLLVGSSFSIVGNNETVNNKTEFNQQTIRFTEHEQNYSWPMQTGEFFSIHTNCQTCTSELLFDGDVVGANQQNYTGMVYSAGELLLVISNPQDEEYDISPLTGVTDNYPATRPAPSTSADLADVYTCQTEYLCIDEFSSSLASKRILPETGDSRFFSGVLNNQQGEYLGFNVSSDTSVEISLEHTSANILMEAYFQNSTDEVAIGEIITTNESMNYATNSNHYFLDIVEDGRLFIKLSSATQNTIWSVGVIAHQLIPSSMINLNDSIPITGHSTRTIIFDLVDTTAPVLTAVAKSVEYRYYSLIGVNWIFSGNGSMEPNIAQRIFPLPTSNAVKLQLSADVFYLTLAAESFADGGSQFEAPSLPPMQSTTENSTWPLLDIFGESTQGEFTNSIRDSSDVYRIEIEAWEDSIHFVMVEIIGDINQFEIEMVEKDQEDWSEVDAKVKTTTLGKLSVAMEVSRGTHFFRISLLNATIETEWGNYTPPTEYTLLTTYELVDEGEEPWFPPDENAEKWGSVARWFMGFLLLVPALYLGLIQVRKQQFAKQMLSRQQRLEWLTARLDSGISPKKNRRDLAKSLDAVATLDWDDACGVWGDASIVYRTDELAIACWKVDRRISKNPDAWPIIIGIYVISGMCEIAALRLDSPTGEPWNIKSVTPRFLHSNYEIFLDTMNEGNKTFLSIELAGSANAVDIELNGRMNGVPFACRPAKTLIRDEEE